MFFSAYGFVPILRLFKLKTAGQTIKTENLTIKLQNSNPTNKQTNKETNAQCKRSAYLHRRSANHIMNTA